MGISLQAPRRQFVGFVERHEALWELTMALLAIAFVIVGFVSDSPDASPIYGVIDVALSTVFIAEFTLRLAAAYDRAAYVRQHWIDALALVPSVRGLRVLRLLRLLRLVRAFAGLFRFITHLERMSQHRGLAWLVMAWLGIMVICSLAMYAAENGVNEAIDSPLDALWWGVVTLTTVGYGDVYPVTVEGRIAATILMLLGIGLFGGITATVTSYLVGGGNAGSSAAATVDQLAVLATMHDAGQLTADEFNAAKRRVLSTTSNDPA